MPFRRGRIYYVDLKPHGYGRRIGPLLTRTTRKSLAAQQEATLRELAAIGRHDLLDALREGRFSVTELHTAKVRGTLEHLAREAQDPLLRDAVAEFRSSLEDKRYLPALARLEEFAPGHARVSWLSDPDNLRKFLRLYGRLGLSAATERREMSGISRLVRERFGESRRGEIFGALSMRRPEAHRTRWLTAQEIERLREMAGDWWVLFQLAIATGLRRGEILALRVCDVNFEAESLVVQKGKSARARRMIPLAGEALSKLKRWVEENQLDPSDLLFPGVTEGGLRHAWEKTRKAAELEDVRFHDLRHTYAVHCSKAGMPLVELQQKLGHATIITLSANVRETRSTQRIRVGRRQRKRTCWDCEREWKRMVVPLEPGRPSEARQLLRTRR